MVQSWSVTATQTWGSRSDLGQTPGVAFATAGLPPTGGHLCKAKATHFQYAEPGKNEDTESCPDVPK